MSLVALDDVMTLGEAAQIWGVDPSTLRHAIRHERFEPTEVRKSHNTWLIAYMAMERLYGKAIESTEVYTIGYEGKSIEEFANILKDNNIDTLFDVREYPLSRKRGFSKNKLAQHLKQRGINYQSVRALGSPKELRDELKRSWNYQEFFRSYENWLKTQPEPFEDLKSVFLKNCDKNYCLMCYEKNALECHRTVIANNLVKSHKKINTIVNL